jgi:hypothetical protein
VPHQHRIRSVPDSKAERELLALYEEIASLLKSIAVSMDSVAQSLHAQAEREADGDTAQRGKSRPQPRVRGPIVTHIGTATYERKEREAGEEVPGFRRR